MIYFNTVALLLTLSSWLTSPALAQEGGILQPVLPSDIRQCSNITVSWSETEPPAGRSQIYAVRLVNSSTAGLELAAEVPITWLGHFSEGETSHNWRVGIPAGTTITLLVTDQAGNRGYSSPVTIQNGTSRCMPQAYEPNWHAGSDPRGAATATMSSSWLLSTLIGTATLALLLTVALQ